MLVRPQPSFRPIHLRNLLIVVYFPGNGTEITYAFQVQFLRHVQEMYLHSDQMLDKQISRIVGVKQLAKIPSALTS